MACSSSPFIFPLQMHGWKTAPAFTSLQGRRSHFHPTSCRNSYSLITEITGVGSSTSTTSVCSTKVWGAVLIYTSRGSALIIMPGKPSGKKKSVQGSGKRERLNGIVAELLERKFLQSFAMPLCALQTADLKNENLWS